MNSWRRGEVTVQRTAYWILGQYKATNKGRTTRQSLKALIKTLRREKEKVVCARLNSRFPISILSHHVTSDDGGVAAKRSRGKDARRKLNSHTW